MKREVKAAWVAALRSGEYSQTRGFLRVEDSFCCLGVLCDLHSKATGTPWVGDSYGYWSTVPPQIVVEWAGLELPDPVIIPDTGLSLTGVNDDMDKTFAEIADIIEGQL